MSEVKPRKPKSFKLPQDICQILDRIPDGQRTQWVIDAIEQKYYREKDEPPCWTTPTTAIFSYHLSIDLNKSRFIWCGESEPEQTLQSAVIATISQNKLQGWNSMLYLTVEDRDCWKLLFQVADSDIKITEINRV